MKTIRKIVICIVAVMMILISIMSALRIQADAIPDSTEYYVNDYADVLSDSTERYLDNKNAALDKGAEILVVTTEYISADDLEVFSYELFNKWGIGSAAYNNGVLIILVTKEGKYWVTPGKGLEDELSSSVLTRILENSMETDFDQGNYDRAVRNTFDAVYAIVSKKYGVIEEAPKPNYTPPSSSNSSITQPSGSPDFTWIWILFVVLLVIIIIKVMISSSRPRNRATTVIYHRPPRPRERPRYYEPPRPDPWHDPGPRHDEWEPPRPKEEPKYESRPTQSSSGWSSSGSSESSSKSSSSWGSSHRSSPLSSRPSSSSSRSSSSSSRASSTPTRSSSSFSRGTSNVGRSTPTRSSGGGKTRGGGAGRK